MTYDICIYVDQVERNFRVTKDQLISNDWNAIMQDMMDTANNRNAPDEPSFQERIERANVWPNKTAKN